jgi:hypothetical protein
MGRRIEEAVEIAGVIQHFDVAALACASR